MKVRYLRSVLSTALSCWFGFLACLLGCAPPTLAASPCEQVPSHELNPGRATSDTESGSSCCNHGGKSSGGQREKSRNGASCCPLNATLTQKHDLPSPSSRDTHVVIPVSITLYFRNLWSVSCEISSPTSPAGRDILLQVHVLRI